VGKPQHPVYAAPVTRNIWCFRGKVKRKKKAPNEMLTEIITDSCYFVPVRPSCRTRSAAWAAASRATATRYGEHDT
jgi:hypothetical protein